MLYNKNNVRKTNDKKILHKVGKQWKVVSVALLMAVAGGAVATTHANAQTNNAATNAEVSAISAPAPVSAAYTSTTPSSATSSASAKSVAPSAFSGVSVASNDSAFTAKTAAVSAGRKENEANNDNATINAYVKSVNAQFALEAKPVNSVVASAKAAAKSDMALANSYSVTANDKGAQSVATSIASKAGFDLNDYVNFIKPQANSLNSAVKSDATFNHVFSTASSLAQKAAFAASNFNFSSAANQAFMASLNASGAQAVAAIRNGFNATNSSVAADHNAQNAKVNQAALVDSVANSGDAYSAAVEATVLSANSSASSNLTKFANNNSSLVSSAVSSYAASDANANSYKFSGVTSELTSGSTFDYMKALVSNSAVLSSAASFSAKLNSVLASTTAAKNSLSAANSSYTAASNSASDALTQVNAASAAASLASMAINSASAMANNKQAFAQSLVSAVAAGKSAVENLFVGASGVAAYDKLSNKEKFFVKSDLASMATANGVDVASLLNYDNANTKSAVKSLAADFKAALGNNYSMSNVSSVANSLAQSGAKAYASASASASSFASSTDENVTLASYYASSYSNDASAEASSASAAVRGLAAYANANGLNDSAFVAALNDVDTVSALAGAYATKAFNYAPKYVTTKKPVALYNVSENGKFTHVVNVPVGTKLTVTGVQISSKNGQLRYVTSYKGKKGSVNSYKSYVEFTYLTGNEAEGATVKVAKDSAVYKTLPFSKKAVVATLPAGTKLTNVHVATPAKGVYGGFTALQLTSGKYNGDFVSANVKYATVVNPSVVTPNKPSVAPSQENNPFYK